MFCYELIVFVLIIFILVLFNFIFVVFDFFFVWFILEFGVEKEVNELGEMDLVKGE